jgi:predicted phage terminase large subunit-like protein
MADQSKLRVREQTSLVESLSSLPERRRDRLLAELTEDQCLALLHDWRAWARPNQLAPPGDWITWLILAGRGFGKTRTGAEYVRGEIEAGRAGRVALVGPTAADVRDVMIEGESGLLAIAPPWCRPTYQPSKRRVTWPNGAIATAYSAAEPERLRGPQHDLAWADEVAAWRRPEAYDQLQFGLRLGARPRTVVTTTPKPVRLIKELVASATSVVTRGSTYDNVANLPPSFLAQIIQKYQGTRLGRQELNAEILEDTPGALWIRSQIDLLRVKVVPDLVKIVVAIDPAVTSGEDADETGIIVAGRGENTHAYVIDDLTCRLSPDGWAKRAIAAYEKYDADLILAEVNNGGDLVEKVLRTINPHIRYKAVHASRGKRVRAEPIAALYEQGRAHHLHSLPALEDQMCVFVPDLYDGSPDRVDALVWALTELMLEIIPAPVRVHRLTSQETTSAWQAQRRAR